jgi:ferredoxin-type protein NapH
MLLSLLAFQPIFCLWVCPLKLGTGFLDPNTATRIIQFIIFVTVGVVFLVLLPLLTKKRAFCGLICPFGAWQAFVGRINPYRVSFIKDKCVHCKQCIKACPTFSIDQKSLDAFKVLPYCNRCGECMDVCPSGAIDYSLVWQKNPGNSPTFARITFLLSAWLVAGSLSLQVVPEVLLKIWKFFFA